MGTDSSKEVVDISVDLIDMNPYQPRTTFNEEDLKQLSASIIEKGELQALVVRKQDERYEMVAGERRYRAAKKAGLSTVPCIVRHLTNRQAAEIALIENLQRKDLDYLEEAEGYQRIIHEFSLTQEELAKRIGKSQSAIANKLRLLKLPEELRRNIPREIITERHARALLALPNKEAQISVMEKIYKNSLTVKETEEMVKIILRDLGPWDKDDEKGKVVKVLKDMRLFLNSIRSVVKELRKTGTDVVIKEREEEGFVDIKIRIIKK